MFRNYAYISSVPFGAVLRYVYLVSQMTRLTACTDVRKCRSGLLAGIPRHHPFQHSAVRAKVTVSIRASWRALRDTSPLSTNLQHMSTAQAALACVNPCDPIRTPTRRPEEVE